MSYKYIGQEKVELLTGPYKGETGYVRTVGSPAGWLHVVVRGVGPKVSAKENEVNLLKRNWFLPTKEELERMKE